MRFKLLLSALLISSVYQCFAQDEPAQSEEERFTIDAPINLDFGEEKVEEAPKNKKPKKKVFYGIKTKKGFTRSGFGERVTYELFYFLKKSETPQTAVRDVYWYNFAQKKVVKTIPSSFSPQKGVLLHGPYEKRQGTLVLQKGIFYKGLRHGRWLTYGKDSTLTDKEKYYRGWPKESLVSYYDPQERKKMKEITPIEFGEKEGFYYRFYENGQVAVAGEYHWDQKVGDWTEYYPSNRRKKIITYPKEAFEKGVTPYTKVEWNDKGKEIYRNNKMAD